MSKRKFHKIAPHNNQARAERIAKIQPMVDKGMMPAAIGREIGMTKEQVSYLVRYYCKKPADYYTKHARNLGVSGSICLDEIDHSHLTPEQIEMANRVGISLGRYAWMLSCPRIHTSPTSGIVGHRGGNTIG